MQFRIRTAAALCCGLVGYWILGFPVAAGTIDTVATVSDLRSNPHSADTVMIAGYNAAGGGGGAP